MKKIYHITKRTLCLALLVLGLVSCEDFLDRPTVDSYTIDVFYQTDEQCFQSVNPIYNSPWYDFQRGFFKIGEVLSGNYYWGSSPYLTFTINSTDEDLVNMSASLWSVNAYCNGVLENIDMKSGPNVSDYAKNTVKGEALVWKAMAYFYLVRAFGAVPIVHNNSTEISAGNYNSVYKAPIGDVYQYIIMTLEKAIEWLPEANQPGRIDRYSAYGLLAKVYLTKSGYGQSGTRSQADLDKAAEYALKVIDESGRTLTPTYSDIFRLKNNFSSESLLAWHWTVSADWTSQNTLQSDLALTGFSEFGDTWGDWGGPSVDLQAAFNENALSLTRNNTDVRRQATMMMYGDSYDYFWVDKGGFNYNDFNVNSIGEFRSAVGANSVKHLVGNNNDHVVGAGTGMANMATSLSTHLLRLADVYLIYAEAVLGNATSTTHAKALQCYNDVRARAGYQASKTSITWRDVWVERRLELACEGDRWYDYVRWHYYEPAAAIAELKAQKRSIYFGLDDYYQTGSLNSSTTHYDPSPSVPNVTNAHFELPFPDTDLTMNPNLLQEPVQFDFSTINY